MMKNIVVLIFIWGISSNCSAPKVDMREIVSEKYVTISMRENFPSESINSLVINIPIEFEVDINFPSVRKVSFYYKSIETDLESEVDAFIVYNGETARPIFEKEQWHYPNYPKSVYLVDRRIIVSKEQVRNLLKKYNINRSVEDIKNSQDTIKIVSYSKFRNAHPVFIEKMRLEPDSLMMRVQFEKGKVEVVKRKIKW